MTLYIVGAGGLGREVLDVVLACGGTVTAFLDEALASQTRRGVPVLHPDEATADGEFVIGIADPAARRRLAGLLAGRGLQPRTLVHPRATIAPDTTIGPGSIVLANSYVSSSTRIGAHCQVQYNAVVGHDVVLDDFVTVYPSANVSGAVHLEEDVTVASNSVVIQGLTVGRGSFVGAGAVVLRDVGAGLALVGNPAKPFRRT